MTICEISECLLKCDYIVIQLSASKKCVSCILLYFTLTMKLYYSNLGVNHDKIILLPTPFPIILIVGTNCYYNVIFVLCWK